MDLVGDGKYCQFAFDFVGTKLTVGRCSARSDVSRSKRGEESRHMQVSTRSFEECGGV